jgi:vancomycin permeability regulator SanA
MSKNHQPRLGPELAVVIGCGRKHEMTLRAERAAQFAHAHKGVTLILSGDGRLSGQRITEAARLRRLLRKFGVDGDRMVLERKANSTIGNAVNVRELLLGVSPRPLYVVTSPFHVPRAMLIFTRVFESEWRIQPLPCAPASDDAENAVVERDLSLTREFFKNIKPGDLQAMKAKLTPQGKPIYSSPPKPRSRSA